MPNVPSAIAWIRPSGWSAIRPSRSTASRSTVSRPPVDEAARRRGEVLGQVAGGVQHVPDVAQGQVAVGQPRGDDGLGHHPDQQDALAGERPGQVEEPVEQVAAEHVAGHVLGRRHPLQRRVREELAGQQRVRQLQPEGLLALGLDLEGVPEAELPVLEAGLLGQGLVEQLADGDGVRLVDGVGGGEVVVLAGVDDDPGAGVHHPAEPLVDEGAPRVDVAEEDPVHRVVEHHVQPLEAGQDGDLGHAEARRVVGQPDVAAELGADVVQGGPHEPEVLLGGVRAGVAGAGGALGHVVQQRLPGGADDGDDVGAGAGGGLRLRDVLVDVAGGHDQVDPGTARRVAVQSRPAPRAGGGWRRSGRCPAPAASRAASRARSASRAGGERRSARCRRPTCSARACSDGAVPEASACQTGSATPDSSPTWSRTASTTRFTHGTRSSSPPLPRHRVGAGQPGQPQHGPLDGDGGVPVREVDDRLRGPGGQLAGARDQRRDRGSRVVIGSSPGVGSPGVPEGEISMARRRRAEPARGRGARRGRRTGSASVAQRARCAGAPTASGPAGCSARAACQPPWVAASKASKGRRPEPGVRWSTAACTPPHGSSGVTGASLPSARATPASARSANGLVASGPLDAEPLGVHAGVAAPGGVEGRLHAGDHPQVAHPRRCRRRRSSPRARAGAGTPGRRAARARRPRSRRRRSPGRPRRRRCTWKPAWIAGHACRRARGGRADAGRRSAGRRRCPAGRCRAAAQRRGVRAEGAVAEQVSPGAGQAQLADDVEAAALGQLAPVAEHPRAGLARRRGPAGRRGPRRRRPRARPSRACCRCPARRPRRAWPAGRRAAGRRSTAP